MVYSEKLVKRYRELHQESPDCLLLMQVGAGLMKIAIYFSEKLILFLFRPPPPPNPLPQGEGGLSLPSARGLGVWTFTPPPLAGGGRGVGAGENCHIFLSRLHDKE